MLQSMNLGWNPDVVSSTGEKFVKTVADTLWILDPHHKQFVDRSCAIPSHFSEFQGFNDWQRKKNKKSHNLIKKLLKGTLVCFRTISCSRGFVTKGGKAFEQPLNSWLMQCTNTNATLKAIMMQAHLLGLQMNH